MRKNTVPSGCVYSCSLSSGLTAICTIQIVIISPQLHGSVQQETRINRLSQISVCIKAIISIGRQESAVEDAYTFLFCAFNFCSFQKSGSRNLVQEKWFCKRGFFSRSRKVIDLKNRWVYTINPPFFRLEKRGSANSGFFSGSRTVVDQ